MSTYHINEATFDVPDGWPDQSINIFPSSRDVPTEFSLVVSRDEPQEGEQLDDYVARQLKQLYEQLPDLRVLRRDELPVDGETALEAEFTWRADAGTMRQRQVYIVRDGKALTLTATALERFYAKYETVLDDLVSSFSFRR